MASGALISATSPFTIAPILRPPRSKSVRGSLPLSFLFCSPTTPTTGQSERDRYSLSVKRGLYPQIVLIVSHISHVVMFDSGGLQPAPDPESTLDTEKRLAFGGSGVATGDGAGEGERDGTETGATAS